jgi:hypothetical protein
MALASDDPRMLGEIKIGRAFAHGTRERWNVEITFPLDEAKSSHGILRKRYHWGGRVSLIYKTEKLVVAEVNLEIRNAINAATHVSNAARRLSYEDVAEVQAAFKDVAKAGYSFFSRLIPTSRTANQGWFSDFDVDGDSKEAVLDALHDWLVDVPVINIVAPEPGLFSWPLLYDVDPNDDDCDHSRFWASRTLRIQPFGTASGQSLHQDWRAVTAVETLDHEIGSFGKNHFVDAHPFSEKKDRVNSSEATLQRCFHRLPEVDIFYFFGHAGMDPGTGWYLARAGDRISARQIDELFTKNPCGQVSPSRPVLVVLNGCDTAGPTKLFETIPFIMARAKKRCFYFLTALAPVPGWAAAEFAQVFLREFLAGSSLVDSVHQARTHLWQEHNSPVGMFYVAEGFHDLKLRETG